MPAPLRAGAEKMRARFHLDAPAWFKEAERPKLLPLVASAVWEQRRIRMHYRSWRSEKQRVADPLGLVLKGGAWYVVAQTEEGLRTYRVARILKLDVLEKSFERPEGFDLEAYWRDSTKRLEVELHPNQATVRLSPWAVYHAGHPELNVTYSWDDKTKLAKLTIQQTQKISEDVMLFNIPLTVRFKSKTATEDRQINVQEKSEDFYFTLTAAPEIVRLDPEYTLLARITFVPPTPMLLAQLADRSDVIGRLQAIEELSKRKDQQSIERLKDTLNSDPFYGVRLAAAQGLRGIQNDKAFEALAASTKQSDARVRRQVALDIGSFYREAAYDASTRLLEKEKNPEIQAVAITSLGPYPKKDVEPILLRELNSDSYHNRLADAAISAMRAQNDPAYINPLLGALRERKQNSPPAVMLVASKPSPISRGSKKKKMPSANSCSSA